MNQRRVERTHGHRVHGKNPVPRIEVDAQEMLPVQPPEFLHQQPGQIIRPLHADSPGVGGSGQSESQLAGRPKTSGAGPSHAADSLQNHGGLARQIRRFRKAS